MINPNQIKKLKHFQEDFQKPLLIGMAIAILATAGYMGMKYRAITLAEKYESKGFGALAVDTLEPFRRGLTSSERGCRTIINAYFLARRPELLNGALRLASIQVPNSLRLISAMRPLSK